LKYRDGNGVSKDPVAAYMWLSLASSQGERFAEKSRNDLQKSMTPVQLDEAQKLIAEWKPKK
jgi:TPR repeat protein